MHRSEVYGRRLHLVSENCTDEGGAFTNESSYCTDEGGAFTNESSYTFHIVSHYAAQPRIGGSESR